MPEEKVLELYGRRVLIMHGDRCAPMTRVIRLFAPKSTNPGANAIPRPAVVCAQTHCRANGANSKEANSSKSLAIMDVNQTR